MGEISEQVYGQLLRHARRVLPPDPALEAADLVQSAWLRAHHWLDGERTEGERVKYLTTTITTTAIDHRRRMARRPTTVPLEDWAHAPGDVADEACARVLLGALLGVVPLGLLLYGLGWTWDEAAAATGTELSTVKTRAFRFRHERAGVVA